MSGDPEPDPGGGADDGPLLVVASDETSVGVDEADRWVAVARATLDGEAVGAGRLDVIFVDEPAITALNQEHLGGDGPTDVLAFPLDGPERGSAVSRAPLHLGDVVVCPAVANRQAPEHCGSYEAEMTLLIVHGVLHVLGHDHADPGEAVVMQARERFHLERHGFRHPVPAGSAQTASVRVAPEAELTADTRPGVDVPRHRA